jgi:nucleoside-diphosphate-sugar epimerase
MKRFLVTGGAGFIGSHIVEALVKRGHFVRVLDNFSSGNKNNLSAILNKIELIKGDIRSKKACLKATKGIDFVLHQAALRSVPKSLSQPHEYNAVNITGTLNLLEASRRNKIKSFVFASTSAIYGESNKFPEKEDNAPKLISVYPLTKLTGEYYCRVFSRNYGLNTVSLRYFNVYGPRQSLDDEYAVVIPKFINCALNNKKMPVYGTGRQSRDFVYVADVVEANMLAVAKKGLKGEVFNVASGKTYTILGLAKKLNEITGKDIAPLFLRERPGDVFKTLADISKAKKVLGFKPTVNFLEGLRLTVAYFKKEWVKKQ